MKNWLPDRCTAILMQGEILLKIDFVSNTAVRQRKTKVCI
jgi:hypothetical protein